ncbi:MAG: ATP-binding protein, partial [Bacteroidota bacterium]|nr:ATP-binding protein [Bacteroidota bacterium]
RRVWPKISSSLPKPFQLQEGQRKDEDAIHEALREALVNALVHADYSVPGGILVKKHPDYFQFSNPGNLLITTEQYYRGGISIPRNNSIQTMFIMLGYGEKAGSGSSRIIAAWDGQHWRKPYINIISKPARVELFLRMESLLPQKSIDNLVFLFGDEIKNLYGDGLVALTTAEIEGSITNTRLQQLVNAHSSVISKLLKELCSQGYLLPSGKGRGTSYQINLDYRKTKETLTPNLDTLIPNLDTLTPNLDTFRIPKKLKKSDLKNLVLKFCNDKYYTVNEIAKMVDRKATYIQNEILPDLIASNKLKRLYPETPHHPNQAYKSAQ